MSTKKIIIACLVLVIPLVSLFLNSNQWGVYATRINQIDFCVRDNQIPCRWINNLGTAYGSPVLNYAAPLPFYVGELIYRLIGNFGLSVKLMMLLPLLLSLAVVMRFSRNSSYLLLIAVTYATLYSLPDAISLIWSLPFYLLLLYIFSGVIKGRILTQIALYTTFLFIIIMSQKEAIYLFLPALIIVLAMSIRKNIRKLVYVLLAVVLSLVMSAYYWFPMVVESPFVRFEKGDYIPVWAEGIVDRLPSDRVEVLTGDSQISNFKEGTDWFSFNLHANSHSIVRLAIYYFPDWKIKANGQEIKNYYTNNSHGFMTVILGKGDYTIEGKLSNTPVRTISNIVSGIGLGTYGLLIIFVLGRTRKFMMYYVDAFWR